MKTPFQPAQTAARALIADLTIVILTNRADARFAACLASAQWAETVLVIDDHSGNDWALLRKDYAFELFSRENKITDFASARSEATFHVKTNWVLFLDSDEILPSTAAEEVKTIITQDLYDAVSIGRVDHFWGKPMRFGETGGARHIRLFKKQAGHYQKRVHETVITTGRVGTATFKIDHFSHENISDFLTKIQMYAQLEAQERAGLLEKKLLTANKHQRTELLMRTTRDNTLQLVVFPLGKFFYNYICRLGFLDGYRGIVYALCMSVHSLAVRAYLHEYLQEELCNKQ